MRGLGASSRWIMTGGLVTRLVTAIAAMTLLAMPAAAQFSDSYKFLKAVRDKDGTVVTDMVRTPGSSIVNTRDISTGETALHIVIKRRDLQWLSFLLASGADPNIRDADGNTPLLTATQLRFAEGVQELVSRKVAVDSTNGRGETPLIIAVQNRDAPTVRILLAAGANPNLPDRIAGMSARDYAARDNRSSAILKMIDDAKTAKPKGPVAGPVF